MEKVYAPEKIYAPYDLATLAEEYYATLDHTTMTDWYATKRFVAMGEISRFLAWLHTKRGEAHGDS